MLHRWVRSAEGVWKAGSTSAGRPTTDTDRLARIASDIEASNSSLVTLCSLAAASEKPVSRTRRGRSNHRTANGPLVGMRNRSDFAISQYLPTPAIQVDAREPTRGRRSERKWREPPP